MSQAIDEAREALRDAMMEFAFHCETEGGEPFMAINLEDAVSAALAKQETQP
jgi:hypothetical protein